MAMIIMCSIALIVMGATPVLSKPSSAARYTYSAESPDGQFVLVMLSEHPNWDDALVPGYAASGEVPYSEVDRIREIRAKYHQSGLYRNDGSTESGQVAPIDFV